MLKTPVSEYLRQPLLCTYRYSTVLSPKVCTVPDFYHTVSVCPEILYHSITIQVFVQQECSHLLCIMRGWVWFIQNDATNDSQTRKFVCCGSVILTIGFIIVAKDAPLLIIIWDINTQKKLKKRRLEMCMHYIPPLTFSMQVEAWRDGWLWLA